MTRSHRSNFEIPNFVALSLSVQQTVTQLLFYVSPLILHSKYKSEVIKKYTCTLSDTVFTFHVTEKCSADMFSVVNLALVMFIKM
jgi:hypothetical protein